MRSTGTTRSPICAMRQPATRWRRCRPTRSIARCPRYRECTPRCMKRRSGSPRPRLASLAMERASVASSEEQLRAVLARLEECRAALVAGGNRESAQLVSVAILDLRMKLNRIGDAELKALCDEMLPGEGASGRDQKSLAAPRRPPLLRVVK